MKTPRECGSLTDVRTEIDRLDQDLLRLLAERASYVKAAARFKSSPAEVAAPERFQAMLAARRQWAGQHGLSPDFVEGLYREIVRYFIGEEHRHRATRGDDSSPRTL